MNLGMTERVKPLLDQVRAVVRDEVMPLEAAYHAEVGWEGARFTISPRGVEIIDGLKRKNRERGLWNFWLSDYDRGHGLTTVEMTYLAEVCGCQRCGDDTLTNWEIR